MPIDRTQLTLGSINTLCSVEWENEFKGKINNLLLNAADLIDITNLSNNLTTQINNIKALPTGSVVAFAGDVAPTGTLLCYGQLEQISLYPALFALLGTKYGGNGTTTFGIPDLRGSVAVGKDNMGGSSANRITDPQADVLGGRGGSEGVQLTIPQLPPHPHTIPRVQGTGGSSSGVLFASNGTSNPVNTGSTGSGEAHPNVQPYITLNYIIRI